MTAFGTGPVPDRKQAKAQLLLWARLSKLARFGGKTSLHFDRTPRAEVLTYSARDAVGVCEGTVRLVGELWL